MSLKKLFHIKIDYKNRIYGFDVMRGLGVLIVLIAHGRTKFEHYLNVSTFISVLGFWLMDLFFVLSAFLIGSLFIKMYEKQQTFNLRTAYDFWVRRWFRTLPNYYLALFLCLVLWMAMGKFFLKDPFYLTYFIFCQSVVTPHPDKFLDVAWTLCIEEWFYLLLPLLVFFFHRFFTKAGDQNFVKRNLLLATIVLFILPVSIRVTNSLLHTDLAWIDFSRMVFFRLDAIAFGIFASWINRFYPDFFKQTRNVFGLLAIATITIYFIYFYRFILSVDSNGIDILPAQQSFFSDTFFLTFSAFAAFCLVIYMMEVKINKPGILTDFITLISIISYSVYIFHKNFILIIINKFFPEKNLTSFENLLVFFFYCIVAILFSIFIYNVFEHPMTQLREKFKTKKA